MLEKTPEQIQEQNIKIQYELQTKWQKIEYRKMALASAQSLICLTADSLIREAHTIYEWLTKELQ